jgi:hypothetical protein
VSSDKKLIVRISLNLFFYRRRDGSFNVLCSQQESRVYLTFTTSGNDPRRTLIGKDINQSCIQITCPSNRDDDSFCGIVSRDVTNYLTPIGGCKRLMLIVRRVYLDQCCFGEFVAVGVADEWSGDRAAVCYRSKFRYLIKRITHLCRCRYVSTDKMAYQKRAWQGQGDTPQMPTSYRVQSLVVAPPLLALILYESDT